MPLSFHSHLPAPLQLFLLISSFFPFLSITRVVVTYMVCLTIFGVNMCVLVLCILHEVRIKRVELHCKWRLVVPSVTWCQKCFVNLMASCNAQDYVFWLIFSQSSY